MKPLTTILLATTLAMSCAMTANAATPRADARQHHQQSRIAHGIANGSLTWRETVRLSAQQHRVQHHERRVKADGVLTRGERYALQQHQNAASRNIRYQKHDGQDRN